MENFRYIRAALWWLLRASLAAGCGLTFFAAAVAFTYSYDSALSILLALLSTGLLLASVSCQSYVRSSRLLSAQLDMLADIEAELRRQGAVKR